MGRGRTARIPKFPSAAASLLNLHPLMSRSCSALISPLLLPRLSFLHRRRNFAKMSAGLAFSSNSNWISLCRGGRGGGGGCHFVGGRLVRAGWLYPATRESLMPARRRWVESNCATRSLMNFPARGTRSARADGCTDKGSRGIVSVKVAFEK